jgi:hypothetical protein
MSGASLSHYLHIYRYALDLFDPDIFIFNVVHNDFDESIHNIRPDQKHVLTLDIEGSEVRERDPAPYTPSKSNRLIRKSALARYLYLNLKVHRILRKKPDAKPVYTANIDVAEVERRTELIRTAVSYILERFRVESEGKRILFVMDGPRVDIYENRLDRSRVLFLHTMLAEACRETGFEFLDLTRSMAEDYAVNGRRFDSELDMHWDEYGHAFVAQRILDRLAAGAGPPSIPPETETQ